MTKWSPRLISGFRSAPIALMLLATTTLVFAAACRAGEAPDIRDPAAAVAPEAATPAAPLPDAESVGVRRHRSAKRLTVAQSIDEAVRRLSRGLDLDPTQQDKLRQILVDQHRRIMELRSGNSPAPVDMAGTSLAIYDQTKARIRAMLNDEQKTKYSVDVPRDDLAPAQADLQHWMGLQEAKRRQDQSADEGSK